MLKALLKWRDFVARIEDESCNYIMPNHVTFSLSTHMPTTRNEFRDCCRSSFSSMLLKYQDEIILLVQRKIQSSKTKAANKPNNHIIFDEAVKPASNPEYVPAPVVKEEVNHQEVPTVVKGTLPTYKVSVKQIEIPVSLFSKREAKS